MTFALLLGFTMAAAVMVTMMRVMRIKRIFGYATPIDIGFTALLVWCFHGTLAGMSGAAVGGLVLAVTLSVGKWLIGSERMVLRRAGRVGVKVGSATKQGALERGVLAVRIAIQQQINAARMRAVSTE